jgi:hypothetical protein
LPRATTVENFRFSTDVAKGNHRLSACFVHFITMSLITKLILFIYFTSITTAYNCTAGFDCLSEQICTGAPTLCSPGTYCNGEFMAAEICKAGHYCPTPAETRVCPSGTICKVANVEPIGK